ncbi:hypothetical protein C0Q59_22990 [Streptomyces albidoflavus]|nr:hypothetical protein C0Q59_22990 [Streptomyces albidoflavus]
MRGWSPPPGRPAPGVCVLPACAGVVPPYRSTHPGPSDAPRACGGPKNPGLPPAQCHRWAHQTPPAQCPLPSERQDRDRGRVDHHQ